MSFSNSLQILSIRLCIVMIVELVLIVTPLFHFLRYRIIGIVYNFDVKQVWLLWIYLRLAEKSCKYCSFEPIVVEPLACSFSV